MKQKIQLLTTTLKKEIVIISVLFLITFLFLQMSPLSIWRNGEAFTDSSVFKTIALQMSKGYIPYRDTFDHKGPLIYILNWLGLFISYYRGTWVIEFIMNFTTFYLMYRISRLCCEKLLSLGCVFAGIAVLFPFFQEGNLTEEYAMPFIAAALYIFLDYFLNNKITDLRLMLCGFSFGCVCLLRPNMIAVWCVFCFSVLFQCLFQKTWKKLFLFLFFFIVGFFIIVAPIMIWLGANNAISFFWEDYIKFNMLYSEASRLSRYNTFLYFASEKIVLFSILATVFLCITQKKLLNISYLLYLLLSLLFLSLSGVSFGHYGMVLVPAVVFPIAKVAGMCKTSGSDKCIYGIKIVLCLYLFATIIMPDWFTHFHNIGGYYVNRNTTSIYAELQDLCRYIDAVTSEDQHISVYGNYNIIYVLSKRLPATTYSYQYPIGNVDPLIIDKYFKQLETELPKIIIVFEENEKLADASGQMEDFLTNNNYLRIQSYYYNDQTELVVYQR